MLAMAGPAEAAIAAQIAITWFGLFVVGGLSYLAFITGRRWIHIGVLVLAIAFGIMFVPWEIPFTFLTTEDREDPDVVMWFGEFQSLAYACYVVMTAVVVNFVQFLVRNPVPDPQTVVQEWPVDAE